MRLRLAGRIGAACVKFWIGIVVAMCGWGASNYLAPWLVEFVRSLRRHG